MRFIGLVGPKGAGKDTVADLLEEMKVTSGKVSFAGPLKKICSEVFGIAPTNLNHPLLKETPFKEPLVTTKAHWRAVKNKCVDILDPYYDNHTRILYNPNKAASLEGFTVHSPRELLQVVGTNFIRNEIFKDWHLHAAFSPESLDKLSPQSGLYAVTDIRFPNEYEFLKNRFGDKFVCYYIERPEAEERLAVATHPSETEIRNVRELLSSKIINDGTIDELKEKLVQLKADLPKAEETKTTKKSRFKFAEKNGK